MASFTKPIDRPPSPPPQGRPEMRPLNAAMTNGSVQLPRLYSSTSGQASGNDASLSEGVVELQRWSWPWWKEWTIIIIVFAITGSTTVRIVRPIVQDVFGIEGSFSEGPWSYRLAYLSVTLPLYSLILLGVGTVAGRQAYFKRVVTRMWGRFVPKRLVARVRGGRSDGVRP